MNRNNAVQHSGKIKWLYSLNGKLVFSFLAFSIIPLAIVVTLSFFRFQEALHAQASNQLIAVRDLKATQLVTYLGQIEEDIQLVAELPNVKKAVQQLESGVRKLGLKKVRQMGFLGRPDLFDLQAYNPYAFHHAQYHAFFRSLVQSKGYSDIWLVSPKGEIIYTHGKRDDFAVNLFQDPYQNTPPSQLFKNLLDDTEPGRVHMTDFSHYSPAGDFPVSFIGTPVLLEDKIIGVLIYELSSNQINHLMQVRIGSWQTGETYLVGEDNILRSKTRLSEQVNFYRQKVVTRAVEKGLSGESGFAIVIDYRGIPVLSAYKPLEVNSVKWVLLAEVDKSEAYGPSSHLRNLMIIILFITTLIIIGFGLAISRSIAKPITDLAETSAQIASGDLKLRARSGTRDEIGYLAEAFNSMTGQLSKLISSLEKQVAERMQAEKELEKYRRHLEALVKERTTELTAAKEQAEAANKAKSLFVANMSHELRSPLNVIMGFSQLIQKEVLPPGEKREYLNIINRNCESLLALINDVLAISKIEAGQLVFEDNTFDLHGMFSDLKKAFESSVDAKGLLLEFTGIQDLPRYVTTDKNKLRQVLFNLLGNAVKFTEQGGITVNTAVKDESPGAMRLSVEVQDTGIGIAEDELAKVFDYFEQTTGGRAQNNGTGLGLAISRDYVRTMSGDITVASRLGKGSVFRFEIGIKKGLESELKTPASERLVMGLQPGQNVPRVLVVEDKRDSRILLAKVLKTAGFEVAEAADGQQAVERFHQWRPGFVWMDIRMPVMDGLEATRRIKKTEAGKSAVVAALTAHALEEEREEILAAGCDDFVRKPFKENEIFEVMAKHLGLRYVYDQKPEDFESEEPEVNIDPEQLAALPEELRSQLYKAVVKLDKEQILALAERITPIDASMARALNNCVQKFALSSLLGQLEKFELS